MATISPTRVSMYDFLYQDTQPIVSLLADAAELSLPQTRLALDASLQAIISALLAYQQHYQGQAVSKKLFGRTAVKELRKYNSMNFATMSSTLYHQHDVADAIFRDNTTVLSVSDRIAQLIDGTTKQAQTLLSSVSVIVLRELAILAEYGQLDHDEINKWFALQPQFLSASRFTANESASMLSRSETITDESEEEKPLNLDEQTKPSIQNPVKTPPPFDTSWYELTGFKPENYEPVQDMQLATGNYLKAIGRSSDNVVQGGNNDSLMFAEMTAISLPHQRWLLQLGKISDIYLERNRLRITSEPATAPKPPLVSLGLISGNNDTTPATTSEKPIEYEESIPLWKNPVILITLLVIGILGALALLKYQSQQSDTVITAVETELEAENERANSRKQQDIAIVKVGSDDEQDTTIQE